MALGELIGGPDIAPGLAPYMEGDGPGMEGDAPGIPVGEAPGIPGIPGIPGELIPPEVPPKLTA